MAARTWQRRTFLKALGAGAASLPLFRLLESSAVEAQAAPMRLLLMYTPYGGDNYHMKPRGLTGTDAALTPQSLSFEHSILEPLSGFIDRMTVFEGLAAVNAVWNSGKTQRVVYSRHEWTAASAFTGADLTESFPVVASGPSLEVALADRLGDTDIPYIQLGAGGNVGNTENDTLTYGLDGRRLPGIAEPAEAYLTLFGNAASGMQDIDADTRQRQRELAVLDAVHRSAQRLRARLGTVERRKLDAHLDALADIERRLSRAPVACDSPSAPSSDAPTNWEGIPERMDLQLDNLVQALACDRTRFASVMMFGPNHDNAHWDDVSMDGIHHDYAHPFPGAVLADTPRSGEQWDKRLQIANLNRWYARKIAAFMERLDAIPEASGSLLDNTLILWAHDFGAYLAHGGLNIPHVLLGGAQGRLRMGRYLNYNRAEADQDFDNWQKFKPTNHLFVSILNAFGVETDRFNSDEFIGPLSEITL